MKTISYNRFLELPLAGTHRLITHWLASVVDDTLINIRGKRVWKITLSTDNLVRTIKFEFGTHPEHEYLHIPLRGVHNVESFLLTLVVEVGRMGVVVHPHHREGHDYHTVGLILKNSLRRHFFWVMNDPDLEWVRPQETLLEGIEVDTPKTSGGDILTQCLISKKPVNGWFFRVEGGRSNPLKAIHLMERDGMVEVRAISLVGTDPQELLGVIPSLANLPGLLADFICYTGGEPLAVDDAREMCYCLHKTVRL